MGARRSIVELSQKDPIESKLSWYELGSDAVCSAALCEPFALFAVRVFVLTQRALRIRKETQSKEVANQAEPLPVNTSV
jgi:hypothetical protein